MSGSTHVFIVCSPRARVGKTLVARLIAEFYLASDRPVSAFDLEPFEPALVEFLPAIASRVSLADTRGQMALFDRLILDDDKAKVIDLGHLALEKFFSVAFDIGFAAEARKKGISALVMYVADQTTTALSTFNALRDKFPDFGFVPVLNDAIARGPELRRQFPASAGGVAPLHIPQLSASLRTVIDRRAFSFAEARRKPPQLAPALRDELEGFVKRLFRELREIELALLMKNLNSTLADSASRAEPF
jgi:hypothetical protein